MNKKGQTEDIFADLIPSIIIIAIGIFLFSGINETHAEEIEKQSIELNKVLQEEMFSLATYLNSPVIVEGVKLTRADLIARIADEQNEYVRELDMADRTLKIILREYCWRIRVVEKVKEGEREWYSFEGNIDGRGLPKSEAMKIPLNNHREAEVRLEQC